MIIRRFLRKNYQLIHRNNNLNRRYLSIDTTQEVKIVMPKLLSDADSGLISEWYKKLGDHVNIGDVLCDIETDDAIMEIRSQYHGTLKSINENENKLVPGDLLAILDVQKETLNENNEKILNTTNDTKSET